MTRGETRTIAPKSRINPRDNANVRCEASRHPTTRNGSCTSTVSFRIYFAWVDTGAERPAPLANGFVGHDDSSFGQQILNIPEAHAVSVGEPDGLADDVGRKAMPMVAGPASVHPGIVPGGELT